MSVPRNMLGKQSTVNRCNGAQLNYVNISYSMGTSEQGHNRTQRFTIRIFHFNNFVSGSKK